MKKANTITIERESSFFGFSNMHVVIDDTVSFWLSNGGFVDIEVPRGQEDFLLQVQDCVFKIVNLKQVKKITLRLNFEGVACSVLYNDGNIVEPGNKNLGTKTTATTTAIMIILLLIFFLVYFSKSVFFAYL